MQKPGLITGLSLTEQKASAGKMVRERKRAEEDVRTSPLRREWGKIELCHTPIQGGRKRKCRDRAEKVRLWF